ncbi:hypothetical protein EYB25_005883 [Talaromyces marneffei]|uniref:Uncharacterized protein C17H9.06c n=1 Tax=Talaromyces marneffei PM1 TaxID=1077442 RepID=A0A093XP63_TALMA|nr:uncharacterized protein EYB26_006823 [Talaromyces marneffei]KAE8551992.1 hypothetical protein EYB25_005883 [Talaromyces marneffei]QGA19135.1 hypothetical protein EYB26_006823 [Talaromyces marneffei]
MAGAKGKKKQSRLAFAPIQDSPPSHRTDASQSALTPSRLRYTNPFTGNITVRGQLQLEDYVRSWGNSMVGGGDKEELAEPGQPSSELDAKRNLSNSSSKQTKPDPISIPQEASSDDEVIRPSKRRRIATGAVNDNGSDQDSHTSASPSEENNLQNNDTTDDDFEMGRRPTKRTPHRRSQRLLASSPTETKARRNSLKTDLSNIREPEDSDANELASPGTHRKRTSRPSRKQKSPSVIDLDDSDVVITSHQRKKRKQNDQPNHEQVDEGEDSDDDIIAPTPSRRSSRKSPQKSVDTGSEELPKTPRKYSQQDELDLEEDLEDLRDTVVREKRTRGSAVNSARSNRQKHLEMLRRRRAGEKDISEEEDEDEQEDEEESQPHYASTAGMNWDDYSRIRDDSDSDAASIIEANEDLDADDSSFVEDDGELGVPVNVPFEFSRHRTKTTRDCFRDVVEWMVHSKLNPAFHRNDDVYKFAFIKMSDEVVGRAGSQLISTVWNADFVNTLRARPHLDVTAYPLDEGHKCDACNRSKHPASSDLKFTGKPYSEETLEPLYESDDSDSDGSDTSDVDGNSHDRDRDGHILPSEDRHYYLGRTCKSNAVLTHTLIHWRFHLYEWVVDYLNHKEELLSNPQKSLEREKMSAKKRTKYANHVVDQMDEDGEVQRLWTDFHQTIRTVREMKDVRQF